MATRTRDLLVAAAVKLLDSGGPTAVTLRAVGQAAGVSHNAPYKHFANKQDLLAAIATRELAKQAKNLGDAGKGNPKPIERLRRMMRGYVRWAVTHSERFKLTFGRWNNGTGELAEAASAATMGLVTLVAEVQATGELPYGDPERMAALLLSLAHGAADRAIGGHLSATGKGHADPEDLVDDLFRHLQCAAKRSGN